MGMIFGISNSNRRIIQIKNPDGTVVGTISCTKTKKKSAKRLQYNFKQISSQILMSKTSAGASRVVTKARGKVAELLRKVKHGEYDDKELEAAIIHAKKMERIARKRKRHLEEEENAKQKSSCLTETEESPELYRKAAEHEEESEISEDKLLELMQEYQKLMEETMEHFMEHSMDELECAVGLDELADEMTGTVKEDMSSEDLERLKKKHRLDELREIMDADMKYLRALFDKLEKEKQEVSSGVSLELAGVDIPVQMPETPVMAEGGSVDVSV